MLKMACVPIDRLGDHGWRVCIFIQLSRDFADQVATGLGPGPVRVPLDRHGAPTYIRGGVPRG
jgi:hypothetical protein